LCKNGLQRSGFSPRGTGSGGPQTDTDVVDINAGHSMGAFIAFSILGSSGFHLH
jgi:hypothetical protein